MKTGGHNFHPSRVPGKTKFLTNLALQREAEKGKKRDNFKPLDLKKQDWSTQ